MTSELEELRTRIDNLEALVRRRQRTFALLLAFAALSFVAAATQAQAPRLMRARTLVIEDEKGVDRVVLGAPLPDIKGGGRASLATGLVINDADGLERFAVGLQDNNRMVMGFDAPPGTGDPRNRERITIVADAAGGAYIRFLNRKTFVPGRLILDNKDQFYLEFLDFPDGKTVSRRIGFRGDEKLEQARHVECGLVRRGRAPPTRQGARPACVTAAVRRTMCPLSRPSPGERSGTPASRAP